MGKAATPALINSVSIAVQQKIEEWLNEHGAELIPFSQQPKGLAKTYREPGLR